MRLALLGSDADSLALAEAALGGGQHQLVWIEASAALDAWSAEHAASIHRSSEWEDLLAAGAVDAVIVGRGANEASRLDQLRKLVQESMPLLLMHPLTDSLVAYYELDMIRQQSLCPMLPYLPARWHPAVAALRQQFDVQAQAGGELQFEQVTFDRWLSRRDRASLIAALARDADLLRHLAGTIDRAAALGHLDANAVQQSLGVQFSGPAAPLIRWSASPVEDVPGARLSLCSANHRAVLHMPDAGAWRLELQGFGERERRQVEYPHWQPAEEALQRMQSLLAAGSATPHWGDAVRSIELVDAAERSLRRGRTVELYEEEASEESTFKGMMAAGGCLLLVAAMALVIVVGAAGAFKLALADLWPYALLAVLLVFLLLQLLRLAFPAGDKPKQ